MSYIFINEDCIPSNTRAVEHRKDKRDTQDAMSLYKYSRNINQNYMLNTKFHLE
jgi:hypothetical protein